MFSIIMMLRRPIGPDCSGVCWGLCLGVVFTCDGELLLGGGETDDAVGETEGKTDGRRL